MAKPIKNAPLLAQDELSARLDELRAAVEQFNDGYWFESHETLEDLWQVTPLPERDLFQAIIQAAAALVHFARGEYPGILKLLDSALDKLRAFPGEHMGIDVAAFTSDLQRVRDEFSVLGESAFLAWDERQAPRIAYEAAV